MKRFIICLVVLTMIFTSATYQMVNAAPKKVLALLEPSADHGFTADCIKIAQDYFKQMNAKYPNIETRLITAADSSEQNNQLDTLINDKVDTIVLWPLNGDDLRSGAQKVIDAGIKLVVFDRLISNIKPLCSADMDNYGYGSSSAQFLNNVFKGRLAKGEKIHVLEFRGDNSTASTDRTKGFNAAKAKGIEVVQAFSTDWQRAKALEQMETFLTNNKKEYIESIDAIFSHDGDITYGFMDAVANYKGNATLKIKAIAGMGADRGIINTFKTYKEKYGIVSRCVFIPPTYIKSGIDIGYSVVLGQKVKPVLKEGYVEITQDNYTKYQANPELLNAGLPPFK